MTKEALKLALEALEGVLDDAPKVLDASIAGGLYEVVQCRDAITAIKEALANEALDKMAENARELGLDYEPAQPFITHNVEQPCDWSEWVCPDPKDYLMKCCDCGLVHEAEFAVVRYKSETEREDCDMVDDPNLQAVFRMRRSEEWTPEDTAHRVGGLPMAQPEQKPCCYGGIAHDCHAGEGCRIVNRMKATSLQRTWVGLTDEEIEQGCKESWVTEQAWQSAVWWAEAKLKEKNNG